MAQQRFLTPDRLYDRPFTAGHPFRRSPSAGRRWTMLTVFILLCTLIGAYLWVTDSNRVKQMAEAELSHLIGAPVKVRNAQLSIFEGLRLDRVDVYLNNQQRHDEIVFSANTFLVNYDLRALLAGRLKLTQIIAIDPHVQLTENLDTAKWNYQQISPGGVSPTSHTTTGSLPALPEIILRNAEIEYSEIQNGKPISRGSMTLEGQLAPSSDGQRYSFELQSRGKGTGVASESGAIGPTVTGTLIRNTGQVTAQLRDFQFGHDIRSMLPAQVRSWWDRHDLAGGIEIPVLTYTPALGEEDSKFRVETVLNHVNLTVQPEEWLGRDELQVHAWAADAFDVMRSAGLNSTGVVDYIAGLTAPSPIQLGQVAGTFEFTEKGIALKGVRGSVEKNEFLIDGNIAGYSPTSPANVHIASKRIRIPATPTYIASMPRQVQELYDHLRPEGTATLQITVDRPTPGARLDVFGEVAILDGKFVFDRFPYPVRNASGKIVFGYDPASGMDQVKLVDLKGKGNADGPNKDSVIYLSGLIGPLTSDSGVMVTVKCDDVHDEPLLYQAFPPEVKQALRNLDADGNGLYPKYSGSFECRVNRPIGPRSIWLIETDVTLRDAAGKFVVFPYLMEHVTGKLAIREGYVDIIDAAMNKGDSSLLMNGRVIWRAGVAGTPLEPGEVEGEVVHPRPDLHFTARNVPIDKPLLDALPEDRRAWLINAGLNGVIDIDGRVWRPTALESTGIARSTGDSDLTHAFDITLRDGTIWPVEGTFTVSNLAAKLHLLPDRVTLTDVRGRRGRAELTGHGEVAWPDNKPSVSFSGTASKLDLDRNLYRVLPATAQQAWDFVRPEGVVDLDLTYRGAVQHKSPAGTQPSPEPALDLIIHPRELAATVQAVPYRLTDITGTVRVNNNKVSLGDLSAKHGKAAVRLAGGGSVTSQQSEWDLRLGGTDLPVDDELRKALPGGLASVVNGIKLGGLLSFEFSKLHVQTHPPDEPIANTPKAASTTATTSPSNSNVDVDFGVKFVLANGSIDVGVPTKDVTGGMELTGTVRNSKLASLEGPLDLSQLTIADRPASDVHAEFYKPAEQDGLRIGKITGKLAGGSLWGQLDLTFPDTGPSRYAMNLILRNADVKELSGESSPDLSGELSASLAVEGEWTNPRSRRGRGDVAVSGKEMYKIPLVLGLLQITNLSLPITSPFSEASARYMVDGPMVTFESLELRSRDMLMSGSGQINYDTKNVRMTFTSDNPNWPKVPILGDIVQTAKHELLQIKVKGTLTEPKVSATSVNTLTTTIDEVLKGDEKK